MKRLTLQDLQRMTGDLQAQGSVRAGVPAPPHTRPPSAMVSGLIENTKEELARLEDALSFVSSDVPRGLGTILGTDGKPVSDYWFGVILAIRREFGADGETLAHAWSQGSSRYTDEGFQKAWDAYDPSHQNPVTIGSVFALAKAFNWSGAAPPVTPPAPSASRFRPLDRAAIMARPQAQWRVKRLFPTIGIGAIYGPSQSGKSFLVDRI